VRGVDELICKTKETEVLPGTCIPRVGIVELVKNLVKKVPS
jgi:hypothetical protein